MPHLGPTELLIVAGVLVLLFGAAKLPKLARSMGESARVFKAETKGIRQDEQDPDSDGEKEDKTAGSDSSSATKQLPESLSPTPGPPASSRAASRLP